MKLAVGIILYNENTAKYLSYFLESLWNQDFQDLKLIIADNSEEQNNDNKKYLESLDNKNFEYKWSGGNIGFARAYNIIIRKAREIDAKYFLAINPDMILEKDCLKNIVMAMDSDSKLGSLSPKVYQWDFKNNKKTDIIDTCGIKEIGALRFNDVGQGEKDNGQFDDIKIIGPSGAAALYRMDALEKIKFNNQYFDELMFMYEEDCDLAYRLQLAGFKSKCVKEAIVYHDRTASAKGISNLAVAFNRKNKAGKIKQWGFLHKHIIFVKYWRILKTKQKTEVIWFAFRMFIFALLFEQYLLKQYIKLFKIRNKIQKY